MASWMDSGLIEPAPYDEDPSVSLRGWCGPAPPRETPPTLSVVVPVFNEAAVIGELHRRLTNAMHRQYRRHDQT